MKKIIKRTLLTLLLILVIGGAAVYLFRHRLAAYFIPEIRQIGIMHVDVKDDTCYIAPRLELTNETFLRINVDTIRYDLQIFNTTYLHSEKPLDLNLPAYGKDTVAFTLKIPYQEVIEDIREARELSDSTDYALKIVLQLDTWFGEQEITIKKAQRIKMPTPPKVELIKIEYEKVRLKHILATARIKITNYSAVTLKIKELRYKMNIFGEADITGSLAEPLEVLAFDTTYVNMPIKIDVDHMGKTLFAVAMNNDNYEYELVLHALLETENPTRITFQMELKTLGQMELRK